MGVSGTIYLEAIAAPPCAWQHPTTAASNQAVQHLQLVRCLQRRLRMGKCLYGLRHARLQLRSHTLPPGGHRRCAVVQRPQLLLQRLCAHETQCCLNCLAITCFLHSVRSCSFSARMDCESLVNLPRSWLRCAQQISVLLLCTHILKRVLSGIQSRRGNQGSNRLNCSNSLSHASTHFDRAPGSGRSARRPALPTAHPPRAAPLPSPRAPREPPAFERELSALLNPNEIGSKPRTQSALGHPIRRTWLQAEYTKRYVDDAALGQPIERTWSGDQGQSADPQLRH